MKKYQKFVSVTLTCLCLTWAGAMRAEAADGSAQTGKMLAEQEIEHNVDGQVTHVQDNLVIRSVKFTEGKCSVEYPHIMIAGKEKSSKRISDWFKKEAEESVKNYRKIKSEIGDAELTSEREYRFMYYDGKLLSMKQVGYNYFHGAAHPTSWLVGATFDVESGKEISWQKLVPESKKELYSLDGINKKLWDSEYGKAEAFYSDFKGLTQLPKNYFLDEKGKIHFVFGQYEIAPYAVGIIDLDMEGTSETE